MTEPATRRQGEDRSPFKALLAAWSLVVVVLAAAGFSSRWNYFYNFGIQNLVYQVPLATLPVYAIQIIRDPANLLDLLRWTAMLIVPFEILRLLAAWAAGAIRERWQDRLRWAEEGSLEKVLARLVSPSDGLVVDALRAGLIVYVAFVVGGTAGTRDYWLNVVEATSRLPRVAAILPAGGSDATAKLPFVCDTRPLLERRARTEPPFVGDRAMIQYLSGGGGCSSAERSWRLLFRDDEFVYLFATVSSTSGRPDTLVLPDSGELTLVMR